MKHLLVGIDFSRSADRALAYAEEVALRMKAKISLVHVVSKTSDKSAEEVAAIADIRERLADLAENIEGRGIFASAHLYEGETIPTLRRVINDGDCDLMVLGCQGGGFSSDTPWGDTVSALMADTRIPILAIPAHAPVKYPRRFLLATDAECPRHHRKLAPLLQLLQTHRTHLILFHYLMATERASPDKDYARLLAGTEHRFYYQADNQQPTGNAVVEFADLIAADLLVVTHHADHWLGNRETDSLARRVSWTSSVPVLILQDSY